MEDKQDRYIQLRRRVNELNIVGFFGIDSLEVVEKLIDELEQTVQSFKVCRDNQYRLESDLSIAQSKIFPLRKEVTKLSKDNHALRLESIRLKDQSLTSTFAAEENVKAMQQQLLELQELCRLKDDTIRHTEAKVASLQHIIDTAASTQSTSYPPGFGLKLTHKFEPYGADPPNTNTTTTTGPKTSSTKKSKKLLAAATLSSDNTGAADTTHDIIDSLRNQVNTANMMCKKLKSENENLVLEMTRRENEWNKFSLQEDGSMGGTAVGGGVGGVNKTINPNDRRILDQLNGQIDFLNEQLAIREIQIRDATEKMNEYDAMLSQIQELKTKNSESDEEKRLLLTQISKLEKKIKQFNTQLVAATSSGNSGSKTRKQKPQQQPQQDEKDRSLLPLSFLDDTTAEIDSIIDLEEARNMISKLMKEKVTLDSKIQSLEQDLNMKRTSTTLTDKNKKKGVSKGEEKDADEANNEDLRNTIHALEDQIAKWTIERERYETMLKDIQKEKFSLERELSESRAILQEYEEKQRGYDQDREAMRIQMRETENYIRELKETIDTLHHQLSIHTSATTTTTTRSTPSGSSSSNQPTTGTTGTSNWEIDEQSRVRIRQYQEQIKDLTETVTHQEEELHEMNNKYQQACDEMNDSHKQKVEYERVMMSIQEKYHQTLIKLHVYEEEIDSMKKTTQQQYQHDDDDDNIGRDGDDIDERMNHERRMNDLSERIYQKMTQQQQQQGGQGHPHGASATSTSSTSSQSIDPIQSEYHRNKDTLLEQLQSELNQLQSKYDAVHTYSQSLEENIRKLNEICTLQATELQANEKTHTQLQAELKLSHLRLQDSQDACKRVQGNAFDHTEALHTSINQLDDYKTQINTLTNELYTIKKDKQYYEDMSTELRREIEKVLHQTVVDREEIKLKNKKIIESESIIDKLKILSSQMDASIHLQNDRIVRLNDTIEERNKEVNELTNQIYHLKESINLSDMKLHEKEDLINTLEKKRSSLERYMEVMRYNEEKNIKQIHTLENRLLLIKSVFEKNESILNTTNESLKINQQQVKSLESRLSSVIEENKEVRKLVARKSSELEEVQNNIQLITKENEVIVAELAQVTVERDEIFHNLQDLGLSIANLTQSKRTIELERDQLLQAYEQMANEKKNQDEEMNSLRAYQDGASHKIKILQEKIMELQEKLNIFTVAEKQLSAQNTMTNQQYRELSEKYAQVAKNNEIVEADNRKLLKEIDRLTEMNAVLRDRTQILMKRAAASSEATKIFQTRLISMEKEKTLTGSPDKEGGSSGGVSSAMAAALTLTSSSPSLPSSPISTIGGRSAGGNRGGTFSPSPSMLTSERPDTAQSLSSSSSSNNSSNNMKGYVSNEIETASTRQITSTERTTGQPSAVTDIADISNIWSA